MAALHCRLWQHAGCAGCGAGDCRTNDRDLNRLVSATERQYTLNVVDDPGFSTVIFPSIVDRSPIRLPSSVVMLRGAAAALKV